MNKPGSHLCFYNFIWLNNLSNVALENHAQRQILPIDMESFINWSSFLRVKALLQKSMELAMLVLK